MRDCWRSKDELISDVLLSTLSHGPAKVRRPARSYIQQLWRTCWERWMIETSGERRLGKSVLTRLIVCLLDPIQGGMTFQKRCCHVYDSKLNLMVKLTSRAPKSVQYYFIAITARSTLSQSVWFLCLVAYQCSWVISRKRNTRSKIWYLG